MKIFWFYRLISGGRRIFTCAFSSIALSFFDILGLIILFPYVKIVTDRAKLLEWLDKFNNSLKSSFSESDFIIFVSIVILTFFLFRYLATRFLIYAQSSIFAYSSASAASQLLKQAISSNLNATSSIGFERLMALSSTASVHVSLFLQGVVGFLNDLIFIFVIIFMFVFAVDLFTVFLGAIFSMFFIFLLWSVSRKVQRFGKLARTQDLQRDEFAINVFRSLKDIWSNGAPNFFVSRFEKIAFDSAVTFSRYQELTTSVRFVIELCLAIGVVVLGLWLFYSSRPLEDVAATAAVSAFAVIRLAPSFSRLATNYNSAVFSMPHVLSIQEAISQLSGSAVIETSQVSSFEAVYSANGINVVKNGHSILNNVSIEIPNRKLTVIVGKSGSGKSTLLDVLCGFYAPDRGEFLMDATSFSPCSDTAFRKMLAFVPQEVTLFSESLMFNIALGREENISFARSVLSKVGLDHLIAVAGNDLEGKIGENAIALSGGERQRLGIARALYRKAKIIVLDEPTSSLDDLNSNLIFEQIMALSSQMAVVLVTHDSRYANGDINYTLSNKSLVKNKY